MLPSKLIVLIQKFLEKRNFVIQRLPLPPHNPIDFLPLLTDKIDVSETDFTVLQVGANDGVYLDPLYGLLQSRNWKALLIEPLPDPFAKLQLLYAARKNVATINCAVAPTDGTTKIYRFQAHPDVPQRTTRFASFDRSRLVRAVHNNPKLCRHITAVDVPSRTIATILREHAIHHLHLLVVDAEGYDYQIIKSTFAAAIEPNIIYFESWHLRPEEKRECADELNKRGYCFSTIGRDTLAVLQTTLSGKHASG